MHDSWFLLVSVRSCFTKRDSNLLLYEGMYGPATYEAYENKYTSLSEYNEKRFWKLGICLQKFEQQSWRKFLK